MGFLNNKSKSKQIVIFASLTIAILSGLYLAAIASSRSELSYYSLSQPQLILGKGPFHSFDHVRTHTLSVVELNKDGYRFWGYYTGQNDRKNNTDIGLAYSNDLKTWDKDSSAPLLHNLRWATVVVVDGVINMFGTRDYGGDTRIVRLTSEDGRNFRELETVVPAVKGEKHQNPFIFYDENNRLYRLYYFHLVGEDNRLEEKHASSINQLAEAPANLVISDDENIFAAPSVFYRDEKYWLTAEMLRNVNGIKVWETLAYVSDNPTGGFEPVENHRILIDDDACYFPYIFDNELNGFYSHKYPDETWEMFRTTHSFEGRNRIELVGTAEMAVGQTIQLNASFTLPDGKVKEVATAATWATSENSIATVQQGKITAKNHGSVVITVSYGGVSTTKHIKVH